MAQNNPLASDENPGTEELFRTSTRRHRWCEPGECVWIYSGVCEMVQPGSRVKDRVG